MAQFSDLANDKSFIKLFRHEKYSKDGKIGLELRVKIEPLVFKPKNQFYIIKLVIKTSENAELLLCRLLLSNILP